MPWSYAYPFDLLHTDIGVWGRGRRVIASRHSYYSEWNWRYAGCVFIIAWLCGWCIQCRCFWFEIKLNLSGMNSPYKYSDLPLHNRSGVGEIQAVSLEGTYSAHRQCKGTLDASWPSPACMADWDSFKIRVALDCSWVSPMIQTKFGKKSRFCVDATYRLQSLLIWWESPIAR